MLLLTLYLLAAGEPTVSPSPDVAAAPCVACRIAPPHADTFSAEEWRELRAGTVLRDTERRTGHAARARATALIDRSPADVWQVLTDFESWPGFMPHLTASRITRREDGRWWVHQDFRVWMVGMRHTTIYDLAPETGRLGWSLDLEQPHDIAASEGRWQLVPIDAGQHTLVRYAAVMDSGRAVPGFVEDLLLKRSLGDLLTSLRDEVLRRDPEPAEAVRSGSDR